MKISTSLLFCVCAVACGGEAISDFKPEPRPVDGSAGAPPGASGGSSGSGGGSGSGGAPISGSGGAAAAGGSPTEECISRGGGSWPPPQPACEDLWVLEVSNPTVVDQSRDGVITAGETVDIRVDLSEVAGYGWGLYPGVEFTSDHPGVSVQWNDWYYAIVACETLPASATVVVSDDVEPNTVVTITARVAMLDTECPSANSIEIPITIQ